MKDKLGAWRKTPLYFVIYNMLSSAEAIPLDGAGGLLERLQFVEPFKDTGISKVEAVKALMFLELNGLVHVRRTKNNLIISLNRTPVDVNS
jgi:hypothetical protein